MKKSSGVLMHISSLWGDYSCGSFGKAVKEWIGFLKKGGFKIDRFKHWNTIFGRI